MDGRWIVYPRRGFVSADWLKTFASDSYSNNADYHECGTCGDHCLAENGCAHEGESTPIYADGSKRPETLEDAIAWLSDTGDVTFGRGAL